MMALPATMNLPVDTAREIDRGTLLRCKAKDPMAFRAFVVRYQRPVFALLSRMLGGDVEDLAQEVFLRVFRAFPTFDVDGSARPSTWVLTIATRLAIDERRRKKTRIESVDDDDEQALLHQHPTTPETERHRHELGQAIAKAVGELPDDMRAVFLLSELHDLSLREIGSALDIPENTVKTRLFRARERLRIALEPMTPEAK